MKKAGQVSRLYNKSVAQAFLPERNAIYRNGGKNYEFGHI